MGIDPGTNILGYGIIHNKGNKIEMIVMDVLNLSSKKDHALKLKIIFESIRELIIRHKVDEVAVEAPFYGKNVQSMLKLGRAQGVAFAAALSAGIPVAEYLPRKIKQAVTGNGNASKEQVAAMMGRLMGFNIPPEYLDATDAMAVAVCHYLQKSIPRAEDGLTGWKAFAAKNPGRISGSKQ